MAIDAATRRNLELTQTLSGAAQRQPAVGDRPHRDGGGRARTGGAAGRAADRCETDRARGMMRWSFFARRQRTAPPGCAKRCAPRPIIARALARLSVARGGPRDLANLRDGIKAARGLRDSLAKMIAGRRSGRARWTRIDPEASRRCRACPTGWNCCWWTSRLISRATAASSKRGVHAPLDELRTLRDESRRVIAGLESKYRQRSGVAAAQDQA